MPYAILYMPMAKFLTGSLYYLAFPLFACANFKFIGQGVLKSYFNRILGPHLGSVEMRSVDHF